jgi:hypothetical protein
MSFLRISSAVVTFAKGVSETDPFVPRVFLITIGFSSTPLLSVAAACSCAYAFDVIARITTARPVLARNDRVCSPFFARIALVSPEAKGSLPHPRGSKKINCYKWLVSPHPERSICAGWKGQPSGLRWKKQDLNLTRLIQ